MLIKQADKNDDTTISLCRPRIGTYQETTLNTNDQGDSRVK